jgi:hypothetical protein
VGRVSEDTGNRELLFDRDALIVSLKNDERFHALAEAAADAERRWRERTLHLLTESSRPIDQRKIDYMRGAVATARWLTGGAITAAEQRMLTSGIHETEESDS